MRINCMNALAVTLHILDFILAFAMAKIRCFNLTIDVGIAGALCTVRKKILSVTGAVNAVRDSYVQSSKCAPGIDIPSGICKI